MLMRYFRSKRAAANVIVPEWLTNDALRFPTILRTMEPHNYQAFICLVPWKSKRSLDFQSKRNVFVLAAFVQRVLMY